VIKCVVKIEFVGGEILRVANEECYLTDGALQFIQGRLLSPVSSYSLGDLRTAKYEELPLTFDIDNNDGIFDDYMPGNLVRYWHGARVTLYTNGTTDLGTVEFRGTIPIGGIRESGGVIQVTVQPITLEYDIDLGMDSIDGALVPFRIGDFTGAQFQDGNALSVVVMVDPGGVGTGRIKVNDGSIDNVVVYRRSSGSWSNVTGSSTVYNALGEIDVPFSGSTEEFRVACRCWSPAYSGPADYRAGTVIQWLLDYAGVPSGEIDSAAFTDAIAKADQFDVRRDISSGSTLYQELSQLALETGLQLYQSREGKFNLQFFMPQSPIIAWDYDAVDESVEIAQDPDRLYANAMQVRYDWVGAEPRGATLYEDATEIAAYGKRVLAAMDFVWLPTESAAILSTQRKFFFWMSSPESITLSGAFDEGIGPYDVFLLDNISLTYRRYDEAPLLVREIDIDFGKGINTVTAWNLRTLPTIGTWGKGAYAKAVSNIGDGTIAVNFPNFDVNDIITVNGNVYEITGITGSVLDISPSLVSAVAVNDAVLPLDIVAGTWGFPTLSHWF
jgi:hypothetical protein